jgi:hypothetical protein
MTANSAWSAPDIVTCEAAKQWWLANPAISSQAVRLQIAPGISTSVAIPIPPLLVQTLTEQMRVDSPLGSTIPVVQRSAIQTPTYPLTFLITDDFSYAVFQFLVDLQTPLLLRDDTGDAMTVILGPTTSDTTLTYVSTGPAPPPTWPPHAITTACTVVQS